MVTPDLVAQIKSGVTVTPSAQPVSCKTTLAVTWATGGFKGTLTLKDASPVAPRTDVPRSGTYQGLIVSRSGVASGYGFFLLADSPGSSPPTTASTSPVISEKARLESNK